MFLSLYSQTPNESVRKDLSQNVFKMQILYEYTFLLLAHAVAVDIM